MSQDSERLIAIATEAGRESGALQENRRTVIEAARAIPRLGLGGNLIPAIAAGIRFALAAALVHDMTLEDVEKIVRAEFAELHAENERYKIRVIE